MNPNARWTALAGALIALGCASDSTAPTISLLQNDNFTNGTPSFQGGFATAEAAAVRLGPPSGAYTIRKVIFLFGGATTAKTVTLTIYQDGDTTNPGAVIHSADYALTGSNTAFQEINLTSQNLHVAAGQKIRVAIGFQHDGLPSVAVDAAITASRNLVKLIPGGWLSAESASFNGDFIIRAEISTP